MTDRLCAHKKTQAGITFFEILLFVMAVGILVPIIAGMISAKQKIERTQLSQERLKVAHDALTAYFARTDVYPCPAPLNAAPNTARFGVGVNTDPVAGGVQSCEGSADGVGVYVSNSQRRPEYQVITGALPVRVLGLSDENIVDGWGKRIVYSVTDAYTESHPTQKARRQGAITIQDLNRNSSTNDVGNVIHTVMLFNQENRGAYNLQGRLLQPCGNGTDVADEMCNFDSVLRHTVSTSTGTQNSTYTGDIRYTSSGCTTNFDPPSYYSILLDSSGSMNKRSMCPSDLLGQPGYERGCSRMNVAQWAISNVLSAREKQLQKWGITNAKSGFSGFVKPSADEDGNNDDEIPDTRPKNIRSTADVLQYMTQENIRLGASANGNPLSEEAEGKFTSYCPAGGTPLGIHMQAMSRLMENSRGETRNPDPNGRHVLTIVSDGNGNKGNVTTLRAVEFILQNRPNTDIYVIDVGTSIDESGREVAQSTDLYNFWVDKTHVTKNGRPNPDYDPEIAERFKYSSAQTIEEQEVEREDGTTETVRSQVDNENFAQEVMDQFRESAGICSGEEYPSVPIPNACPSNMF